MTNVIMRDINHGSVHNWSTSFRYTIDFGHRTSSLCEARLWLLLGSGPTMSTRSLASESRDLFNPNYIPTQT